MLVKTDIMPFGQYKGKFLYEVPRSYFIYLIDTRQASREIKEYFITLPETTEKDFNFEYYRNVNLIQSVKGEIQKLHFELAVKNKKVNHLFCFNKNENKNFILNKFVNFSGQLITRYKYNELKNTI